LRLVFELPISDLFLSFEQQTYFEFPTSDLLLGPFRSFLIREHFDCAKNSREICAEAKHFLLSGNYQKLRTRAVSP
jgi:hypothetical protein